LEQFNAVGSDSHGSDAQVDVFGCQRDDLTAAEAAPCAEQDSSTVPGSDGLDERDHLGDGGNRTELRFTRPLKPWDAPPRKKTKR
jgi:hypothetical protein